MSSTVLITESGEDTILLKSILETTSSSGVEYIAAGGWSSADSLARSYLTDATAKVAIVVDADTSEPKRVEERRSFLQQSLGQIALSNRYHVLVIEPEIEALPFDDRTLLEDLIQAEVSDTDMVRGQYGPKKVLAEITHNSRSVIYSRLSDINLERRRNRPDIRGLSHFLKAKRQRSVADDRLKVIDMWIEGSCLQMSD